MLRCASLRSSALRSAPAEFKDSGLLSSKSHTPSPASESRSTTPTPGNPQPELAQQPGSNAPVARSGILRIRVTAGKGLSLPQGGE